MAMQKSILHIIKFNTLLTTLFYKSQNQDAMAMQKSILHIKFDTLLITYQSGEYISSEQKIIQWNQCNIKTSLQIINNAGFCINHIYIYIHIHTMFWKLGRFCIERKNHNFSKGQETDYNFQDSRQIILLLGDRVFLSISLISKCVQ